MPPARGEGMTDRLTTCPHAGEPAMEKTPDRERHIDTE